MWLTVAGLATDDGHPNDFASRISGPERDMRIGAAPLTPVPASDGDGHVAEAWIRTIGVAGLVSSAAGIALGAARAR